MMIYVHDECPLYPLTVSNSTSSKETYPSHMARSGGFIGFLSPSLVAHT